MTAAECRSMRRSTGAIKMQRRWASASRARSGGEIEETTDGKLMREFIDRIFQKYLTRVKQDPLPLLSASKRAASNDARE